MARGVGAARGSSAGDIIRSQVTTLPTNVTIAIWHRRNGDAVANGRIVNKGDAYGLFNSQAQFVGTYGFYLDNALATWWRWAMPSTGVWTPTVITIDRSGTADPIVYSGSSGAVQTLTRVGTVSSWTANTSRWDLGNRASDNARGFDGDLDLFAVVDGIWDANAAKAFCAGVHPINLPGTLVECLDLDGILSGEISYVSGVAAPTVTGTVRRNCAPHEHVEELAAMHGEVVAGGGGGTFQAAWARNSTITLQPGR